MTTPTVPKMQAGSIAPFVAATIPIIPGGDAAYTQTSLQNLTDTVAKLVLMCPQSAVSVPKKLKDGMIRLARSPWYPVSGQTADAWVYYDAAGGIWSYLSTAPTNTG